MVQLLKKQTFRQAFLLLILAALVTKGLGLLREMIVAGSFGASAFTDHFFIAWVLPMIFGNLIAQALSSSVIPTLYKNRVDTKKLFSLISGVLLLLSVVIFVFSAPILRVLAPLYKGQALKETLFFFRGLTPAFFFLTSAGLMIGYFYSKKQFILPSFGSVFFNGAFILSLLLIAKKFPVKSLILGANLGAFLFWILLLTLWLRTDRGEKREGWRRNLGYIKRFLALSFSILAVTGASYINRAVDRILASFLQEGDVSYLYFGARLMWIPIDIFIATLGTSIFPFFSQQIADGEGKTMGKNITTAVKWAWIGVIPASILLIFFSEPIVSLIYGNGAFGAIAIKRTASVLTLYSIGIFAIAGNAVLFKALYAVQAKKLLFKVALLSITANILLDLLLIRPMGVLGIALSTSLVEILSFLYLVYSLRLFQFDERRGWLFKELKYFAPSTLVLCALFGFSKNFMPQHGALLIFVNLTLMGVLGYSLFLLSLWVSGGISIQSLRGGLYG